MRFFFLNSKAQLNFLFKRTVVNVSAGGGGGDGGGGGGGDLTAATGGCAAGVRRGPFRTH